MISSISDYRDLQPIVPYIDFFRKGLFSLAHEFVLGYMLEFLELQRKFLFLGESNVVTEVLSLGSPF